MVVTINETRRCITMPPMVQSAGLLGQVFHIYGGEKSLMDYYWYDYSLPRLEVNIALLFIVTQIFHSCLKRLGFPLITSQLLAGLLFSEAILGEKASQKLWNEEAIRVLGSIGILGYAFFIFLMGVKTDVYMITKSTKTTTLLGILSVITPLIIFLTLTLQLSNHTEIVTSMLCAPIYVWTAFPVITVLLTEKKILNSELGRMCQSVGIIGDFVTYIVAMVSIVVGSEFNSALRMLICFTVLCVVIVFILRPILMEMLEYHPEGKPINRSWIYVILVLFLICLSIIRWFGPVRLMAVYTLGLAIPHGPPLGSALVDSFESMTRNLLIPLFVSTCGLRVKSFGFLSMEAFVQAQLCLLPLVVKFLVCFLPQVYKDIPVRDALAFSLIICTKGVIDMANFAIVFDEGLIDEAAYGIMFTIILLTASFTPIAVKKLYDPSRKYAGYIKRNLMGLKSTTDLPLLAIVHIPDNVGSIINLLTISSPNKDTNPINLNVLHLVKLSGQAAPVFISHQKKPRTTITTPQSENLIISFNRFEATFWGAVTVNTHTAISPQNLMHDDICSLALDTLTSLIVLPFHRRWYIDGSVESDNETIRNINTKVLHNAPCSVAILVDRGFMKKATKPQDPTTKIALLYIGGTDDREALMLSKRMAQSNNTSLTLLHLTSKAKKTGQEIVRDILDNELLKSVKSDGYVNFVEQEVVDGTETAMVVKKMVNEYNLIVVGRRHDQENGVVKGINEWSEFPELGGVGDLLACVDYGGRCSVLVVQQQQCVVRSATMHL